MIDDSLSQPISERYRKFFEKFKEIDTLPRQDWKIAHLLSYLCRKYEQHYGFTYTFTFDAAPSKCFEVYQLKKLTQMLSSDPNILIQYIDFVFKEKVISRKKKITSLGYFTNTEMVNDFKFKFLFNKTINRASPLPDKWLKLLETYNKPVFTYGDLAFLFKMNKLEDMKLFNALYLDGLNLTILENLK